MAARHAELRTAFRGKGRQDTQGRSREDSRGPSPPARRTGRLKGRRPLASGGRTPLYVQPAPSRRRRPTPCESVMSSAPIAPRQGRVAGRAKHLYRGRAGLDRQMSNGRALNCRGRDPSPGRSARACHGHNARLRVTEFLGPFRARFPRLSRLAQGDVVTLVMLSAPVAPRQTRAAGRAKHLYRGRAGPDRQMSNSRALDCRGRDPSPGRSSRSCRGHKARLRVTGFLGPFRPT